MLIAELILATQNKNKVAEINALLEDFHIKVKTVSNCPEIIEDGETLEDNAILKARTMAVRYNSWAFADDSGLEVDALGGAPGVRSARYAGEGCSYEDNNWKLLKALKGIPEEERKAQFRCVIAVSSPEVKIWTVEGRLDGFISLTPKGHNGFGYDPIFYYPPADKRLAEMDLVEKNMISHRGKALKNFIKLIQSIQDHS
ncbi:MAG: XTP/dITP diphosphatase [bacterium]